MFSLPPHDPKNAEGSSADNPIILKQTSAKDFRAFLRVLYPLGVKPLTGYDDWLGVLRLSHKWEFIEIRKKAIRALSPLVAQKTAGVKIGLGRSYHVKKWLEQGLLDLTLKADLEMKELQGKPFYFDHETIAKFSTSKAKHGGSEQLAEISKARFVSEGERHAPRKPVRPLSPVSMRYDSDSD